MPCNFVLLCIIFHTYDVSVLNQNLTLKHFFRSVQYSKNLGGNHSINFFSQLKIISGLLKTLQPDFFLFSQLLL